jgi:hypothetical protein
LACQDEFLVNKPLPAKENDEHALDFVLHLSHFFLVTVGLGFPIQTPIYDSYFLPHMLA